MAGSIAAEIRSKSVWQVMVSYGIGSWIVLQIADTLSSLVGLPLWFGQALLVLLGGGVVVLLATSLVQRSAATGAESGVAGWLTWRNALRGGVGAVVLLGVATGAYLAMRTVGFGPVGTLQARGVFDDQERIILADFEGNVEQDGLTETVTTLLRIDLAQSRAFTVLEPVQLAPVLARMQREPGAPVPLEVALEAARREGIKAVVAGELLQAGGSVVVSARIVVAATGEVLAAVRETARTLAEIPKSVDRVSAQLRERIGESLRTIHGDRPLEQVTTSSLQALEKYAQANRANDAGDVTRAIALLEDAIAEDTTFAMAHRKLGILLQNRSLAPERQAEAFTRAYELRERLTDRERWLAEAAYLAYVADDAQGATDRYLTLLEAYPADPVALNNLALNYRARGRDEDARELYLRSIRNGGAPAATYAGAVTTLYFLGDTTAARETLEDFEETHPDNPTASGLRVNLRSAVFDYVGAEIGILRMIEQGRGTPAEAGGRLLLGHLHLAQGRVEEGWADFRAALVIQEDAGLSGGIVVGVAEALVGGLVAIAYDERPAEAAGTMDRVRLAAGIADLPLGDRQDLQFAGAYAAANRPTRARELMEAYASEVDAQDLEDDAAWLRAQGLVALAEGRPEEAITLLHRGREASQPCVMCGLQELGNAFDASAQPDSAIDYYERYMGARDLDRLSRSDNLAFWSVVPRLGELQAEHGDGARARELFTLFLDVTQGADAAYAAKRDRIRQALRDLGGG